MTPAPEKKLLLSLRRLRSRAREDVRTSHGCGALTDLEAIDLFNQVNEDAHLLRTFIKIHVSTSCTQRKP